MSDSQPSRQSPSTQKPATQPPKRPFQFGLASMLLVTLLFSVLAAAGAGMLRRSQHAESMPPGFFVIMAVTAPMGIMILLSLLRAIVRHLHRRRP